MERSPACLMDRQFSENLSFAKFATYASSVSFGHPGQFFDSLDTQKFKPEFADDDNFRR